jgi:hypothetical protein
MATPEQDYSAQSNLNHTDETIELHGIVDLLAELAKEDLFATEPGSKNTENEKKRDLPPLPDLVKRSQPKTTDENAQINQANQTNQTNQVNAEIEPANQVSVPQPEVSPAQLDATLPAETGAERSEVAVDRPNPSPATSPNQAQPTSVVVATDKLNALLDEVSHLRDAQTNLTAHISHLETQLKEAEARSPQPPVSTSAQQPSWLARSGFMLLVLLVILIPTGIYQYFHLIERRREKAVALKLASVPQLSVYRIDVDVRGQDVYLQGRLPHRHLRDLAAEVAAATLPGFEVNNEIIAIATPADPVLLEAEAQRLAKALNQVDGMNINAQLQGREVNLTGTAIRQQSIDALAAVFGQIPGIETVTNQCAINHAGDRHARLLHV